MNSEYKFLTIFFWITLMLAAIYIIKVSIGEDTKSTHVLDNSDYKLTSLPSEEGVFSRSFELIENQPTQIDPKLERTLSTYYNNRAYVGAPPTIPHKLLSEEGIGGKSCLQCHENGGYVSIFNAYAPTTPHPEYSNCKQCHVPQKTTKLFVAHEWEPAVAASINNSALPGSPPVIPHGLQLRANCLACHGGPSAPREIRVSHPERSNCRQCHVPASNFTGLTKNMKNLEGGETAVWSRDKAE